MFSLTLLKRTQPRTWLMLFACIALGIALLAPRLPLDRQVFDLLAVVDITQSMNALDYELDNQPASRLAVARRALHETLRQLPCGSTLGMGIFTEYRTFLLFAPVEVCSNYRELAGAIDTLNGQMAWAGGSEIAKGLYSGLLTAKALDGPPSLLFITDGHEAPPLNPHHRPAFTGRPGDVGGIIIGAGGLTPMAIPKFDPEGNPLGFWKPDEVLQTDIYSLGRGSSKREQMVEEDANAPTPPQIAPPRSEHLSSLHEDYLKLLATETRLSYRRLATPASLAQAVRDAAPTRTARVETDVRWIPAALALVALVAAHLPRLRVRPEALTRDA